MKIDILASDRTKKTFLKELVKTINDMGHSDVNIDNILEPSRYSNFLESYLTSLKIKKMIYEAGEDVKGDKEAKEMQSIIDEIISDIKCNRELKKI